MKKDKFTACYIGRLFFMPENNNYRYPSAIFPLEYWFWEGNLYIPRRTFLRYIFFLHLKVLGL